MTPNVVPMSSTWVSAIAQSAAAVATTAAVIVALAQSAKSWRISLRVHPSMGEAPPSMAFDDTREARPTLFVHVVNDALRIATVYSIRVASYPQMRYVPTALSYFVARRRQTLAGPAQVWSQERATDNAIGPGRDRTFPIRAEALQKQGALAPRAAGDRRAVIIVVLVEDATRRTHRAMLRVPPEP